MIFIQLSFNIILYNTILGTSVSSTIINGLFLTNTNVDITEILLKVVLNTHNLIINSNPHYLNHTDTDINHKTCIQKKTHTNSNIWSAKKCKI